MRKSTSLVQLTFLTFLFPLFTTIQSNAQCIINSNAGYSVSVSICPKSIVVSTTDCPWGYNYNVRFDYEIAIIGNPPGNSGLNTLQTKIYCNNSAVNGYYALPLNGGSGSAVTTTNPFVNNNGEAYQYTTNPSCDEATVSNLNCVNIGVIIQGAGIPNQEINCNCSLLVLPVEFLSFEAEKRNDGNLLTWAVQSEKRNDYFTIETSADGVNWKELTKVKGAVNSTEAKTYTFFDTENTRESVYYKLSQTDLDGTRNELALDYIQVNESDFELYPNPSSDSKVHITFSDNSEDRSVLTIRNELGQVLLQQNLEPVSKSGRTSFYNSDLDLTQPAGIYFVEVSVGDQLMNRSKLVIR